jgi:hypothetical protein
VVAEDLRSTGGGFRVLLDFGAGDPSCTYHYCAWATEAQAAAAFLSAPPATLHLDHAMKVAFVSADYYLPDNAGGISLNIAAVPEPETYAMMLAGLGLLGGAARRRRTGTR